MIDIYQLLESMRKQGATDLFLSVGVVPTVKIKNNYVALPFSALEREGIKDLIFSTLNEKQQQNFLETNECNIALEYEKLGRFRLSAYVQKSRYSAVIRMINDNIPSLDSLQLPPHLNKLVERKSGLIVISGPAGAGKSTTMASLLEYRNANFPGHIICIEDPMEYLHEHKKSIITQREVGTDTASYEVALHNCLRQAPSVLMIGEIRSTEVMSRALHFAETGHLCIATMHANNTYQTLERIGNFYRDKNRDNMLNSLSLSLQAIVCQKLLPTLKDDNVVPAVEIMLNSAIIADRIRKGEFEEIPDFIEKSKTSGMQTFDQAVIELFKANKISDTTAIQYANSQNDVRLQIRLSGKDNLTPL
jgi:twitching motility protein PilU